MTKAQKIEYINKVRSRFEDAENHGISGSNWWYPTANTIAYNIKVYGIKSDSSDLKLSDAQKEYYNSDIENTYQNAFDRYTSDIIYFFMEELRANYSVISRINIAGRSGGWLEVEYHNILPWNLKGEFETSNYTNKDINIYYKDAQYLEDQESKIAEEIKNALKGYINYMNDEFNNDFLENDLLSDDEIRENYISQVKELSTKI